MIKKVLSGINVSQIYLSIEEQQALNDFNDNYLEESPLTEAENSSPQKKSLTTKFAMELLRVK